MFPWCQTRFGLNLATGTSLAFFLQPKNGTKMLQNYILIKDGRAGEGEGEGGGGGGGGGEGKGKRAGGRGAAQNPARFFPQLPLYPNIFSLPF
jgi:hypothetical protein